MCLGEEAMGMSGERPSLRKEDAGSILEVGWDGRLYATSEELE